MYLTKITLVTILRLACFPEEEDGTVVRHDVGVCDNEPLIIGKGLPSLVRRSSVVDRGAVFVHTCFHGKVTWESSLALSSRAAINLRQVSQLSDFTGHLFHARAAPVQGASGAVYHRCDDSPAQLKFVVDRKFSLHHLVDLKVDIPCRQLPVNWSCRVGVPTQCGGESLQEAPQHHHCKSPGPMLNLQDRGDYSSGQGCCQKERGGREDGEADARGEEG